MRLSRSSLPSPKHLVLALSFTVSALPLVACVTTASTDVDVTTSEVRSMTREEALADFDQLAGSFKSLYGALERKQARYGFSFDAIVAEYRARVARATSDAEVQGIFVEFDSRFRDAHVSLSTPLLADDAHVVRLPVSVMPVEDTLVVYDVSPAFADQVKVGDELLAINAQSAVGLSGVFMKYVGTPNSLANRHMAAARLTSRPAYLSRGLPGTTARLVLRGADGQFRIVELPWKESPHLLPPLPAVPQAGKSTRKNMAAQSDVAAEVTRMELAKMGSNVPFFMTPSVRTQLGIQPVTPSAEGLASLGVSAEAAAQVNYFAGTYTLEGKRVLIVRIPSYTPEDENAALGYLAALIREQQPNVDALVVDQTHNPGGSLFFALNLATMLSPRPINGFVQKNHADRKWLQAMAEAANEIRPDDPQIADAVVAQAQKVDAAYSAHLPLSEPLTPFAIPSVLDPSDVHWTKPMLMLVDELAVSCGDIVPALLKANGIAPLFGQTTMGGGGNVEEVATLNNSRWVLRVSRGLGTVFDPTGAYPEERFIEDNGVTPDVVYSHTLADFRAGYVGYVKAFNAELAKQLAP